MKRLLYSLLALLLISVSPWTYAMNGVFWQPQLRDNQVSEANWQFLMKKLRQQGVDTLIVQWTRYGDAFTVEQDRAFLLKRIGDAHHAGLKVIIGLNSDPDFFNRQKQPPAAQENYLSRLRVKDIQQARLWVDELNVKPDGWYISAEIDDLNWREEAVRTQMLKWLGDTRRLLSEVANKPVYISSFFAGNMSPDAYRQLIAQMRDTGVNVWVQDGSGVNKLTNLQRELYLEASAGCKTASPASGIVYELFTVNPGETFSAKVKQASEIKSLLAKHSACNKDTLYFSLRYLPVAHGILDYR